MHERLPASSPVIAVVWTVVSALWGCVSPPLRPPGATTERPGLEVPVARWRAPDAALAADPPPASAALAAGGQAAPSGSSARAAADAGSSGDALPSTADGPRLPAESIRRVVRWNAGRFRDCYQRALVASPRLTGHVGVRFWIDAEGRARDATVEASDLPPPVASCIAGAFGELRFPALDGGPIGVRYGFVLGPDGATPRAEPTGETLEPNRQTPSDDSAAPSGSSEAARSRLFRLFLAGLEQGPAPPSLEPPAARTGSEGAAARPLGAPSASASGARPARVARCAAYDPLCDEL